jgi:hypothetical protein
VIERLPKRIRAKIVKIDVNGCWLWRTKSARGYGKVWWEGRSQRAHRVTYTILVGPIPDGCEIDHKCRVHSCVNPAHMQAVPHPVNVERGEAGANMRVKTHCPRQHPYDAANTYVTPKGARQCRACNRIAVDAYNARKARL